MRLSIVSLVSIIIFGLVSWPGYGQGVPTIPPLSRFKQPVSKCLKPSDTLIITQLGRYQNPPASTASVEVVATTQVDNDPSDIAQFDHAAITIYDSGCTVLYRQLFPGAGEATFDTIKWDRLTLLHLVTISAVGRPGDDVIYNHIILIGNDDGSFFPVQPPFLTADKYLSIYVGNIGEGKGFGIVETLQPGLRWPPHLVTPLSFMFRLTDVELPEQEGTMAFGGPTVIRPPPHKDPGTAWPDNSYATGFPLMH
jgi:hypothetical protein